MSSHTSQLIPAQARAAMARGAISGQTSALCPGFAQANLVILTLDWAQEFALFCRLNPKPCPLLEQLEPGQPFSKFLAPGADLRECLPRYRVWRRGELVDEPLDIHGLWRADLVSFFLGCSFSFDLALREAGVPVRHLQQGRNVPMYRTNRPNQPAGRLAGPLVVSMRPMPAGLVELAVRVSGRFKRTHGAPVYWGDPAGLGIADISQPDFGEAVEIEEGEVPVFWACGVTPQAALMEARPELAITHAPGCMFISDRLATELD